MTGIRVLSIVVVVAALSFYPVFTAEIPGTPGQAAAQTDAEKAAAAKAATDKAAADAADAAKKAAASKTEAEKAAADAVAAAATAAKAVSSTKKPRSYAGEFQTPVLADNAVNELKLPIRPTELLQIPDNDKDKGEVTIDWPKRTATFLGSPACSKEEQASNIRALAKKTIKDDPEHVILLVSIPPRPCWWPLKQDARIKIQGQVAQESSLQTLFDGTVQVSVSWIPLLATFLVLALIYPGCAIVVWYLAKRRYNKDKKQKEARNEKQEQPSPSFLASLDPVQITANQHGRASLAKLQIFVFSLLVFGLLFYYQIRYGILSGMSKDVLLLMGISAGGAVAGKITYTHKRRLSLETWAWLVERGWLPKEQDEELHAKWSELVLDGDSREFDPYSFQMAVFSLVVAVALVGTGVTGLGTFEIPQELLALLGLSQAVFIGGKAAEPSTYVELEAKVSAAIKNYRAYLLEKDPDPAKKDAAWKAFKISEKEAGEMFLAAYGDQLPEEARKEAKDKIAKIKDSEPQPS